MTIVVITGFMGTGKSTVGRSLADRLGVPFVDTDALIERDEGRPVSEIFANSGEVYFRSAEKRAITSALGFKGAVVATGGGAIVDADNRALLKAAAPIVCLTARPEVIARRARAEGDTRPLLSGNDSVDRIRGLLAERADAYGHADLQVDTSDREIDELVDELASFLRTQQ